MVGESALRHGKRFVQKKIREHPAKAVRKAESRHIKARLDYHYRMAAQEHPEMRGNALSRLIQKQKIKRQYAKQAREAAKQGAKAARACLAYCRLIFCFWIRRDRALPCISGCSWATMR